MIALVNAIISICMFILRFAIIVIDIIMSFSMLNLSVQNMKTTGKEVKETQSDYTFFAVVGVLLKAVYWHIVPNSTLMVQVLIGLTLISAIITSFTAFVFMLPIKKLKSSPMSKPSAWLKRSVILCIVMLIMGYILVPDILI